MSRWLGDLPGVNKVESAVDLLDPGLSREQYQQLLSEPNESLPSEEGRRAVDRTI